MPDIQAAIQEISPEAQYDENAKMLLAQKPFLANILIRTVKEFEGMNPAEVEKLIEGEPSVGRTPVEPGFTNEKTENGASLITGMNTENKVRNEGVVYFDIIFYVRIKDGISKVIINLEMQKDEPSSYDVEMRGIFYAAREISSQLGREFKNQKYNDISSVYSIWILMNTPSDQMAKIHLTKEDVIGQSRWKETYDVLNVVIIRLKKSLSEENGSELHRLLGALFIPEVSLQEREDIIQKEFGIEIKGDRKEMLHDMCNLGQGILEQGLEQGLVQGLEQGLEQGLVQGREKEIFDSVQEGDYSVERGAQKLCLSVREFEKKMEAAGYKVPEPV